MEKAQQPKSNKIVAALFWKFLERIGVNGTQFILQMILARLLSPEHYGTLSLMLIFISLARVFTQGGFSTSLVQNKEVTEDDYSSVLWVSLLISATLYIVLFIFAPLIAEFYDIPEITRYLRVLALILFPGALNSVQLAKLNRELDFKKIFVSNLVGIVISGVVGIIVAYLGGGVWALVVYNLLNVCIACITMRTIANLKLKFICNLSRIKILFSYGWKLLVSRLIETLYQDLRSLVVGKKYSAGDLGYYERGKQFPQFVTSAINTAIQSVMLPVMSQKQTEPERVKEITRKSVSLSSYIILPMLAGLAAVSGPIVTILLGEKWLPCVPYMQAYCFTMAFIPIHTGNLQAINAVGRSDIYLKLEVIKKIVGLISLFVVVICFDTPLAIAMTGVFTTIISCFINAFPNKKLIGYSYLEQMKDILPSLMLSLIMIVPVLMIEQLNLPTIVILMLQISVGAVVYLTLSVIFRLKVFTAMLSLLKGLLEKR